MHVKSYYYYSWLFLFALVLTCLSKARVHTVYTEKPKILVGKPNGSGHSIWKGSEIMGCWLR